MSELALAPFRGHHDPQDLVDNTDLAYEERLALLQEWQSALARAGAPEEHRETLLGAIHSLEMGAEVQNDKPAEAPDDVGYGAGDRD